MRSLTAIPALAIVALLLPGEAGAAIVLPPTARVTEGRTVTVTVGLGRVAARTTRVRWTLTGRADFVVTKGTLRFAKGRRRARLTLRTRQDTLVEGSERVTLKIGAARLRLTVLDDDRALTGAAPGAPSPVETPAAPAAAAPAPAPPSAPAPPTVSISDLSRTEGPASGGPQVTLDAPAAAPVTVHVASADGTATAGQDFAAVDTDVTVPAGQTSAPVPLTVTSDPVDEPDAETLTLRLSAPRNAVLGDAEGVVTLLDDDPAPTLDVGDRATVEQATAMPFTVSLSHPSAQAITVQLTTSATTASSAASCAGGADFITLSAHALTFSPGETTKQVAVTACEDVVDEADETFELLASNLSSGAVLGDASGRGTILDDE